MALTKATKDDSYYNDYPLQMIELKQVDISLDF